MTDARSGGAHPGARGDGPHRRRPSVARRDGPRRVRPPIASGDGPQPVRHPVLAFFRANPQVFVLLVICLVLGLGTFLAVLFGLVTAPTDQTTGEPSGAILGAHAALKAAHWLSV